ncbi:MAG: DUF6603 domain-containing protein [Solirubrobacterales bacterium]
MPDQPGSIERLALELGGAIRDVGGLLGLERALETLAQFGIAFPPQLLEDAGFSAAREAVVSTANELDKALGELGTAIEAGDEGEMASAAIGVVTEVAAVVASFVQLKNQLDAVGPAMPGVTSAQVAELTADFPKKLFDFLIVNRLDIVPAVGATMTLLGLIERTYHPADPNNPTSASYEVSHLRFDRLGPALTNPAQHFSDLYQWGSSGFDGSVLLPALADMVARLGLPSRYVPAAGSQPAHAELFAFDLAVAPGTPPGSPPGLAVEALVPIGGDVDQAIQMPHPAWKAHLKASAHLQVGVSGTVTPPLDVSLRPPTGDLKGEADLTLEGHPKDPFILIGAAGGSRLEVGEVDVGLGLGFDWNGTEAAIEPRAEADVKGGKVVIDTSEGDGLIAKLLAGQRVEADFEAGVSWAATTGVKFHGSSGLEIELPVHIELGPLELPNLYLVFGMHDSAFSLELSADLKAALGPLEAVVHRLGAEADLSFPAGGGNIGPAQLDFLFKPPNGVGLSVDAGPIKGGGFLALDFAKGEYFGALELTFEGLFSLKAVGIVNTKMPDGKPGFALLILVTAEFTPIQLGFGFTLIGVGGLLGLNRSLDTEALRQGVRTGSIQSVLFPPDVVGNITKIVSDLKSFFPITEGHFIVAPMGKLGWGTPTLISLELGVIIDIPSPQLSIIGVLRCILPDEEAPILRLQVAFAGGIDFDKGLIWFDASLFDSGLLTFTLSGDMALRIGWGDESIFVISVGGFHPAFHEVPSDLTQMKRLTIALLSGNNPRLVALSYFAVTSNTVQSGARVELYAAACGFNIYGYLGYDLLIQFDPFHFIADIGAGLALRQGDDVIAGIDVSCELSGPTPWHAKGHASLEILFFSIDIGFDETWGEPAPSLPPLTVDVKAELVKAVEKDTSWRTELPSNASQTVTLREIEPPSGTLLAHPFAILSVSQKVVPLGMEIDRFGNAKPSGEKKFEITAGGNPPDEMREEFAIANFVTLSDDQKLARKSFEQMKSGLRFGTGEAAETGATVHKDVDYELSYVHRHRGITIRAGLLSLLKPLFELMLGGGAVADNAFSVAKRRPGGNGPAPVEVTGPEFQVVNVSDLSPAAPGAVAKSQAEAWALHDEMISADPSLAGTIQVVAEHELMAA